MDTKSFETYTLPPEIQKYFMRISNHLRYKSRFSLPQDLTCLVDEFIDRQIKYGTKQVEPGTTFFRARIEDVESAGPFTKDDMGAPPARQASSGRINPEGIPYLYLADCTTTAISEVRPWKGARISVGMFKTARSTQIVSLLAGDKIDEPIAEADLKQAEVQNKIKGLMNGIILKALYFSAPAHNSDKHAYLASQYIAERFKERGIDGLEYKSVLNEDGINTVFFDVDAANCVDVTGFTIKVVDLY